jgi:hypothetical protein
MAIWGVMTMPSFVIIIHASARLFNNAKTRFSTQIGDQRGRYAA